MLELKNDNQKLKKTIKSIIGKDIRIGDSYTFVKQGYKQIHDLLLDMASDPKEEKINFLKSFSNMDENDFIVEGLKLLKPDDRLLESRRNQYKIIRFKNKSLSIRRIAKSPCYTCGSEKNIEVHHVIPLSQGGHPFSVYNLLPICKVCHSEIHPWLKSVNEEEVFNDEVFYSY